jgi:putative membrane protein insertion efficiency factor
MTTVQDETRDRPSAAARVLVAVITGYRRFVSPMFPPRCRFLPSCSAYALEAVQSHGAARGCWLAARRLSRCHPFHAGGLDPVPTGREPVPPPGDSPALPTRSQGASW